MYRVLLVSCGTILPLLSGGCGGAESQVGTLIKAMNDLADALERNDGPRAKELEERYQALRQQFDTLPLGDQEGAVKTRFTEWKNALIRLEAARHRKPTPSASTGPAR
jgi:hypothetical protein